MCGISGIINASNEMVKKNQIKKINDLIAHRGPDDEGFFFDKNFALGHRRLSILDLSDSGHQPMEYLKKYAITYNGEIYNYIEIKEELSKEGYVFQSTTDTEVILASYDKWGENCVSKFNGMWSFAIYDRKKKIIFCSRDRFGIKPFYFTKSDNQFAFGSEIKQLLEFQEDRYVNIEILLDYLVLGLEEHTDETFFKNIHKLQPAHNLIYDLTTNHICIIKYYEIKEHEDANKMSLTDNVTQYSKELNRAIHYRLRSDVKVGTCLSGGLDSSAVAAIASKDYYKDSLKKMIAIHAKSTVKKSDESFFAQEVSKSLDLDLNIIEPTKDNFKKAIDEVIYTQEEPFGGTSIFMQYFVMEKAKALGCKVMLDGQGGDETLLGYERYYPAYLLNLPFIKKIKGFINSSRNSKISGIDLLKYLLYFTHANLRFYVLKKRSSFVHKSFLKRINIQYLQENARNYLNIFQLQKIEINTTQLPHLLKYEDKNSMKHSIETRLPFLDYQTLETALNSNAEHKISNGWTKYLLRKSITNSLPQHIVWRKNKFGFEAPENKWITSIENDIKKEIQNSNILNVILQENINPDTLTDSQKWKLYNIAKWEKMYHVKIDQNK